MLKRNGYLVAMPTVYREGMAVDSLKANGVFCACFTVTDSRAGSPRRRRIAQGATLKGYGSGSPQYMFAACDCFVEGGACNNANDALGNVNGSLI
jgi:hypothetical protein